jgi:NADP-dependent 3-hydroxy acid dehydrogenase YdfG
MQQGHSRRTSFVTGASYGVGAATALALAQEGYDVAISATRAENLKATLVQLERTKSRVIPLVLDLGSQSSIERAVADVVSELGELDLLVNNAAVTDRKSVV